MPKTQFKTHKGEPLVAPRANMNGTSRVELMKQYAAARCALTRASQAVAQSMPHGRDYQTCEQPQSEYFEARLQHQDRIVMLEKLSREFADLADALAPGADLPAG